MRIIHINKNVKQGWGQSIFPIPWICSVCHKLNVLHEQVFLFTCTRRRWNKNSNSIHQVTRLSLSNVECIPPAGCNCTVVHWQTTNPLPGHWHNSGNLYKCPDHAILCHTIKLQSTTTTNTGHWLIPGITFIIQYYNCKSNVTTTPSNLLSDHHL